MKRVVKLYDDHKWSQTEFTVHNSKNNTDRITLVSLRISVQLKEVRKFSITEKF